ncbi:MAG TPA: hypothetical protein VND19_09385 [Acetobacteraceae bacterium]|nr:hypothetical protein [Acetobacteraceae bacterium]
MPGSWQPLNNQPSFNVDAMMLLTDGSIMCHEYETPNWHKLVPDKDSDYASGTWHTLSPLPDNASVTQNGPSNAPLFFASAVLRDGTVFCAGGEYNNDYAHPNYMAVAELYDPVTDVWTPVATPVGWTNIGDASSCVLPDGRVLLGNDDNTPNNLTAIWDPESRTWSNGGAALDANSEEGWTLLPDGTVLAVQCSSIPNAQKYVIATNQWVTAGSTPQPLPAGPAGDVPEMGPQILLPDGRVFAIGASGHTALYTPPATTPTDPGTWAAGPDFPADINGNLLGAVDAPACLLPSGNVLCVVGSIELSGADAGFAFPAQFFEFDGTSLNPVPGTASAGSTFTWFCRLLLLPTGQVLLATCTDDLEIYTPAGGPQPAWRPHITHVPRRLHPGRTYRLHGRQLNGLSQACAYGDDQQMATNYPLVRLWGPPAVGAVFCRTFDHSTMGVATGDTIHHTHFEVPHHLPHGEYKLVVIANGIASEPVEVHVRHGERHDEHDHDHHHDEDVFEFAEEDTKFKDKDAKEAKEKEKDAKEVKEKEIKESKEKDCKEIEQKGCKEKEHKEFEHKGCKEKEHKEFETKGWKEHAEQAYCPPHKEPREYDELLHRIGRLADRLERIEDESRRRPFIREEERPSVGDRAMRAQDDERRQDEDERHRRGEAQRRQEQERDHNDAGRRRTEAGPPRPPTPPPPATPLPPRKRPAPPRPRR